MVAVGQQPQHDPVFVFTGHGVQRGVAEGDDGGGTGVVGVALVDPAGVHQPDPGRQLGGHVDDVLAGADELLGQQRPHAGGTLDRPSAGLERGGPRQQPDPLMAVSVDPELSYHRLLLVDGGGGVGTLVRVDPDRDHGVLQTLKCGQGAPPAGRPDVG